MPELKTKQLKEICKKSAIDLSKNCSVISERETGWTGLNDNISVKGDFNIVQKWVFHNIKKCLMNYVIFDEDDVYRDTIRYMEENGYTICHIRKNKINRTMCDFLIRESFLENTIDTIVKNILSIGFSSMIPKGKISSMIIESRFVRDEEESLLKNCFLYILNNNLLDYEETIWIAAENYFKKP